jgi:two-component system sensor histidine kinase MprB
MTIRSRIALVSATAVAVAVVLISVVTFVGARRQIMSPIDESLLVRADIVEKLRPQALFAVFGIERIDTRQGRIVPPAIGDFDASYYQVIFGEGLVVNAGAEDLVLPEPTQGELDPIEPSLRSVWVGGVHLRIATIVRSDGDVVLQIGRTLTEADTAMARLAVLLLVAGVVGVALAGGLGLLVSKQAVKPIDALAATVGSIAETQSFSERVDVDGDDEVAALSTEFNALLDELESAKQEQARLVRDAGHELRTPLTALRTNLEVLQRHEVGSDERAEILSAAHAEVEELALLVAEVVDLASDRYEVEPVGLVDLDDVATAVISRVEKRMGRDVVLASDGSVVDGKRHALERALSNIIQNADKFSPEAGEISVFVSNGTVTVSDSGSGFDTQDLPYVFERFYRSDAARSESGSGLGLSIVKQIIDDHRGEVFARNGADGGAEVGFVLPRSV